MGKIPWKLHGWVGPRAVLACKRPSCNRTLTKQSDEDVIGTRAKPVLRRGYSIRSNIKASDWESQEYLKKDQGRDLAGSGIHQQYGGLSLGSMLVLKGTTCKLGRQRRIL